MPKSLDPPLSVFHASSSLPESFVDGSPQHRVIKPGSIREADFTGESPRLLVAISTGFEVRQFVHSGILDRLVKAGCRITVVSPNEKGDGFVKELPGRVNACTAHLTDGPLRWRFWSMRGYLLSTGEPTETMRQRIKDWHRTLPVTAAATRLGNRVLHRFPYLRQRTLSWERLMLQDRAVESLLDKERIDLVLLGTPGQERLDAAVFHAAARRGIPVVATVLSWDNLTSRGVINPDPDCLLVWSDHMKDEAVRHQKMDPERVIVTGAPLYDHFARPERFGSRSENLQRLGLDPQRRLIVYGTNHAGYFPDEIEIVRKVADWVEQDRLGQPCQLWIRLHPQAVNGQYRLSLDSYRRLASNRIKVEIPPVRESQVPWELPRDDIGHLVSLLRDADVVINTASTFGIDAAALDRPVISIAFDPAGDLPYERSVRRYYDYTHMAHVVRAGATQLASSTTDLREKISRYLEDPALDRDGRRRIVEQQFGRIDGNSAGRVADQVLAVAKRSRARAVS